MKKSYFIVIAVFLGTGCPGVIAASKSLSIPYGWFTPVPVTIAFTSPADKLSVKIVLM